MSSISHCRELLLRDSRTYCRVSDIIAKALRELTIALHARRSCESLEGPLSAACEGVGAASVRVWDATRSVRRAATSWWREDCDARICIRRASTALLCVSWDMITSQGEQTSLSISHVPRRTSYQKVISFCEAWRKQVSLLPLDQANSSSSHLAAWSGMVPRSNLPESCIVRCERGYQLNEIE